MASYRSRASWAFALLLTAAGCEAGTDRASQGGGSPADEPVSVRLDRPTFEVGSLDGPDALEPIVESVQGPRGRVFLIQPLSRFVLPLDPTGVLDDSIGGAGAGPSEFLLPERLGFLGDTLWVFDAAQQRLVLFRADGLPLGERAAPTAPPVTSDRSISFVALSSTGIELFEVGPGLFAPPDAPGSFPILARHPDGALDTIALVSKAHSRVMFMDQAPDGTPRSAVLVEQPFSDASLWTASNDPERVVVVDRRVATAPDSASYLLSSIALSGDTVFSVRVPYTPGPVLGSLVDSIVDVHREAGRPEELIRERLFFPAFHPEVTDVVLATDGSIWVQRRPTPAGTSWDVFGPAGGMLARVESEEDLRVLHVDDDGVWTVRTDEFGVPYVGRHPRPPGSTP